MLAGWRQCRSKTFALIAQSRECHFKKFQTPMQQSYQSVGLFACPVLICRMKSKVAGINIGKVLVCL
jgi:hypothetical protein